MLPAAAADALRERLGDAVQQVVTFRGEVTVLLQPDSIVQACTLLRDELGYNYLVDLTAVDYLDREPRFDVVYHLLSFAGWTRLRLKVQVNEDQAIPSLTSLWMAANWAEREVWDLFGVEFAGHPNLQRLMMPVGWVGHPLRKDYPQTQMTLPRPKYEKVGSE